jgi:hypothetical protein
MAKITKEKLSDVLTKGLKLKEPEFDLKLLPGGKLSGSVISDTFKGIKDSERQTLIWDLLEKRLGEECMQQVGTLLAYTKAEWNVDLAQI